MDAGPKMATVAASAPEALSGARHRKLLSQVVDRAGCGDDDKSAVETLGMRSYHSLGSGGNLGRAGLAELSDAGCQGKAAGTEGCV